MGGVAADARGADVPARAQAARRIARLRLRRLHAAARQGAPTHPQHRGFGLKLSSGLFTSSSAACAWLPSKAVCLLRSASRTAEDSKAP